jgi:hypothetical protein
MMGRGCMLDREVVFEDFTQIWTVVLEDFKKETSREVVCFKVQCSFKTLSFMEPTKVNQNEVQKQSDTTIAIIYRILLSYNFK